MLGRKSNRPAVLHRRTLPCTTAAPFRIHASIASAFGNPYLFAVVIWLMDSEDNCVATTA